MQSIKKLLMKVLSTLCIVIFILITAIGTWQVITRYVLNNPSAWSEEILTYGFVWMAMLASAYVFGNRKHMRLTFLIEKLSLSKRKKFEIITEILNIVFNIGIHLREE